jgi:hypothetical protein
MTRSARPVLNPGPVPRRFEPVEVWERHPAAVSSGWSPSRARRAVPAAHAGPAAGPHRHPGAAAEDPHTSVPRRLRAQLQGPGASGARWSIRALHGNHGRQAEGGQDGRAGRAPLRAPAPMGDLADTASAAGLTLGAATDPPGADPSYEDGLLTAGPWMPGTALRPWSSSREAPDRVDHDHICSGPQINSQARPRTRRIRRNQLTQDGPPNPRRPPTMRRRSSRSVFAIDHGACCRGEQGIQPADRVR